MRPENKPMFYKSIYLAAPWANKNEMPAVSKLFEDAGLRITHKWWDVEDKPDYKDAFLRQCAYDDYNGVMNADVVIVINRSKSEGKAVEQGIAIAAGKPIVIVGMRGQHSANVFHYMDNYIWVENVPEAVIRTEALITNG